MAFSMFAALALAASPAAVPNDTITHADRPAIAAAARRMNVSTRALVRAVTARPQPRRSVREVRYCVERARIVSGRSGNICHTAQQWAQFGIAVTSAEG